MVDKFFSFGSPIGNLVLHRALQGKPGEFQALYCMNNFLKIPAKHESFVKLNDSAE